MGEGPIHPPLRRQIAGLRFAGPPPNRPRQTKPFAIAFVPGMHGVPWAVAGMHMSQGENRLEDVMSNHDEILNVVKLKNQIPLVFQARTTALLVIDMQRYFVRPEHAFGRLMKQLAPNAADHYFATVDATVIKNIRRLLERFRALNAPVLYTATGCSLADGGDLPKWFRDFDQLGLKLLGSRIWPSTDDPSYEIDPSVMPRAGELILHKAASGPLGSTYLVPLLHRMGVDTLVVCGLTTDVCVTQAAREAADRDFAVIIADDACAALSEDMHRIALQIFNLAFGRAATTDEILGALTGQASSHAA
jgi:biuret amidohydrolase